jgi:DUF917 family protein
VENIKRCFRGGYRREGKEKIKGIPEEANKEMAVNFQNVQLEENI